MTSWWKGSDIRSVIDALLQTITRPQSLLPKGRGTMRRYTFRPSLEVLEQRTVLTTISQYGSLQAAVGAGSGVTPNYNSESRNNPLSLSYSNSVADPTSGATGSYTVSTNASFSGSVNSWTGNMAGTGTMQYPPHNGGGGYAAGSQITIAVDTSETFQFTYNISESAPAPNFQTDAGVEIVKNLGASQLEILANITMGSGSYSVEIDPGNIYTIGCGVNFQSDPNIGQYTNSASMSWQLLPLTPAVTPTTTTISASPNPSAFGQPASFTASVSPTNSSQLTPTGTVTFMDGSTALNPGGTPLNASGTAIFAPSTMLTIGTHSITAVYSGDNNFSGSTSSPVLQTVAYTPSQISTAYGIGSIAVNQEWPQNISANGAGQTIAIIAYNDDPNIANDLSTFDSQFGLPQFNTGAQGSPMFAVVNQYDHSVSGNSSSPDYVAPDPPGTQRSLEEAMDVEWAHAIAPGASIVLIEINPSGNDVTDESWAFSTVNGLANGTLTVPNMPAIPNRV